MARTAHAIDVVTESSPRTTILTRQGGHRHDGLHGPDGADIENRCLKLLLQQQPVARDLRAISAAMKMVTDLQRIGDQAANIAEISLLFSSRQGVVEVPQDIGVMA